MYNKIIEKISELDKPTIVAIDGRCGAGKTTVASKLQDILSCNVIHMDDFFLRPEQRKEERLNIPGENVDHERFLKEVLLPLSSGEAFSYRPFNCKTQSLMPPIDVTPCDITIIEGSYSCHNNLWDYYNFRIFVDVDESVQLERIINRNGQQMAQVFKEKWIPLEEKYFEKFNIKNRSDIVIMS
ncbi:MAG: uridine kinase [Eubacteriales bacterium]|nr:uridine kinase [Eubacteriales bacterium]